MVLSKLRGVLFVCLMFYAGLACSIVVFPSVITMIVPSEYVSILRRRYNTLILGHFSRFAGLLVRTLYGTHVFIYCDTEDILHEENRRVLISSNHRTRIDWMFIIWIYGSAIRKISDIVVVLKHELKKIPIIGWCMQATMYLFLQRERKYDIPHIKRVLRYLMNLETESSPISKRLSLLIFPEGTDLSNENLLKNGVYSKKHNLPDTQHVLHPKSTGLATAIECFRESDQLDDCTEDSVLHDLTMAYEDGQFGVRPSEKSLFTGDFPRAVHILVERHVLKDLPQTNDGLSQWVKDSFQKKEALLNEFYVALKPQENTSCAIPTVAPCRLSSWPQLISHPLSDNQSSFSQSTQTFLVIFFLMSFLTLGCSCSGDFQYCVFLISLTYTTCLHFTPLGGLDNVELKLHGANGLYASVMSKKKD